MTMKPRNGQVMVTGAGGFVGSRLCEALAAQRRPFVPVTRHDLPGSEVAVGEIGPATDWSQALAGCRVVVHLAARVHVTRHSAAGALADYRRVNVEGTLNLARQAAAAGVARFVFISSIKVNGESTDGRGPFSPDDPAAPGDAYAVSKLRAEQGLMALARETGMEVVIIRPPLVHGPGVKGNFASMLRWVRSGLPLPLGAVENNRRSLLALDNLVDLIVTCLDHPAAGNDVFLAADDEDLSTASLLQRIADSMEAPVRLVNIPPSLLELVAAMTGKRGVAQRLCGSLQIDVSRTRERLGWVPRVSVDEGLRRTVQAFDDSQSRERTRFARVWPRHP